MKDRLDSSFSPVKTAGIGGLIAVPFLVMALANLFKWEWLTKMDFVIGQAAVDLRSKAPTGFFRVLTEFGGPLYSIILLLIVCSVLFFMMKRKDLAIWYFVTVAFGAGVLNKTVKYLFRKPRPSFEHLVVQGGYSFPSGHAMGSIIIFGGLLFLIYKLTDQESLRWLLSFLIPVFILLIGISRIYLGVHYPSDIIGGYSLGGAWLFVSVEVFQHLRRGRTYLNSNRNYNRPYEQR